MGKQREQYGKREISFPFFGESGLFSGKTDGPFEFIFVTFGFTASPWQLETRSTEALAQSHQIWDVHVAYLCKIVYLWYSYSYPSTKLHKIVKCAIEPVDAYIIYRANEQGAWMVHEYL